MKKENEQGLLSEQDGAMREKMCIFPKNMCIFLYVLQKKMKKKKKNEQGATQ